ncbi:MAG: hypothetical protein HOB00_07065 [Verrucomicrobia bacterium]|nr:hypothetical protein [Verrucomicrobiota bacterium]
MKLKSITAATLLFLAGAWLASEANADTLFESGAKWSYYKGNDHPSGGDLEWAEPDFDDSDWPSGASPIRYGDGNGGTVIGDMRNTYSTMFFRRTFTVPNPAQISALDLLVDYDDGFVVWINGEQVLNVGGSADFSHDSFASISHESGNVETFALANPGQYLVDGKNLIAIMGFNINLTSSDFMMDAELRSYRPDKSPPKVVSLNPPPGNVSLLREITVRFDEQVTGVDADDLWLNGDPAVQLRGGNKSWTFTFAPGDFGEATLSWKPNHGIADTARPPNPMATAAATHHYRIVDDMPPSLATILPPPGSTVRGLSRVRLFFSEPVRGFDVSDLRVNGQAPTSLAGVASGPWQIEFEPAESGIVTIAWMANHGITDLAAEPNRLAAEGWHYKVDADHDFGQVVINEFLAANRDGLKDDDGEVGDWIELRNNGGVTVDLAGWSLSDDSTKPGKWVFPGVTIRPSASLIVHATGKNRRALGQALHTNFKLGVEGEYLGLFSPELPRRVADEIAPAFPEQRSNISYGRLAKGGWAWFATPTPGLANRGSTIRGMLAPPLFSAQRGIYDAQFRVHLTTGEPGAVIRYTTDYSEPTATNGKKYTNPLAVRRTTVVRAAAFKSGMLPSRVETHTYAYNLSKGVTSLPMMSLVTENSNLWGNTGIMETNPRNTTKRGIAWERPVSMELIYPDTGETLQANAGLRVQGGNYIRGRYNPNAGPPAGKYSFRLYFRGDYGPGRLRHPFFPALQVEDFNHIVLRAGMNDNTNPFVIDELVRRLSADMGQVAARGTFMNLYLNGKSKGYYNPTERIDSDFLNSWNGGESEWDIIAQYGELREGDMTKWNELKSALLKNLSVPQNYAAVERLLNVDNFIDYIMLNVYANTGDWPHNNWRAARERVPGARWRFLVWDAEWSFGNNGRGVTGNNLTSGPLAGGADIALFYRSLQKNPEFRMRFADRVQIHYFNGGALTDENVLRRFREMKEEMTGVISNMNSTVETTWVPRRRAIVMSQMATQNIQASAAAPQFSQPGGAIPAGYSLNLTATDGVIYYTTDGSDPRRPGEVAETGKTILNGSAGKWALVPSADNGGNTLGTQWRGGREPFDHDDWDSGNDGVGYDQNADYDPHIGIDVDSEMNDINQSVFVRIPFRVSVEDRKKSNFMVLRMKYDDGFVAYLNGTRIVSANAAANPGWNAGATGQHDDASAVTWVSFDAGKYINKLKAGNNILAIHGLNSGLGSSDMLINAELSIGERSGAEIADGVLKYTSPVKLTGDTTIRTRTMYNGQWSALVEHSFQAGRAGTPLRFTEIMYNPLGGSEYEFVELHNSGTFDVSLGWHRFDGIDFTFAGDAVIGPGEFLVLASDNDPDAFKLRYPGLAVDGWYRGSLSNNGERLALLDARWRRVVEVDFSDGGAWPSLADGDGHSLELIDLLADPGAASNWRDSAAKAGSPGEIGASAAGSLLIINEVHVQSPLSPEADFVELRNLGQVAVDLSGWTLRDGDGNTFGFPDGTALGQAGLLGVWCGEGEGDGLRAGFGLGQAGDSVALFDANGSRVDAVTFGAVCSSIVRTANGWTTAKPTFGKLNQPTQPAALTNLVINEWLADPAEGGRDWLELYNPDANAPALITGLHIRVDQQIDGLHRIATIPPRGHMRVWFDTRPGPGHVDLSLPADGATITLITSEGVEFATMKYARQRNGVSEGRRPDGSSGTVKFTKGATPGAPNIVPSYDVPRLNEVLAFNRNGPSDWVELYNDTGSGVSLDGVSLSRRDAGAGDWTFPAGTTIKKGGTVVVRFDGNQPAGGFNTGVSLPADGGGVYLFDPDGFLAHSIEYGFQVANQPIGMSAGRWQLLSEPTPGKPNAAPVALASSLNVVFNEWMAKPTSDADWFELYNPETKPVDIGGMTLTEDSTAVGRGKFTIPDRTYIPAQGWVRWLADGTAEAGHVNFSLRGQGELLRLYGSRRSAIDEVEIFNAAEGFSRGRLPDGAETLNDFPLTPTPGGSNYLPIANVVINEVLSHTDAPLEDAIELHNSSESPVDISGWLLGDALDPATQFTMPPGTVLAAGGYTVIYEGGFNRGGAGFSLNSAHGDTVYLSAVGASGKPTGFRAVQTIPPMANGVSVGRVTILSGVKFVPLAKRTFGVDAPESVVAFREGGGAPNAKPQVGPVVISEIMYEGHPDVAGLGQAQLEYVELHNISEQAVPLFNPVEPQNTWRIRGGVKLDFPANTTLPPGGYQLIVGFAPVAEPVVAARFREHYDVPSGVTIVGPFDGRLANGGETVRLLQPDNTQGLGHEDAGFVPYLPVENVSYDNRKPWPRDADGTGLSLQRKVSDKFGNEPDNWLAAAPTAGRANAKTADGDRDADGMDDAWELAHKLNPANAADALVDADNDGVTNLGEFRSGTDPNDADSRFLIKSIEVTEGRVTISVHVSPGHRYRVEFSEEVNSGWTKLAEFTTDDGQRLAKAESNAPLTQARFYRIQLVE